MPLTYQVLRCFKCLVFQVHPTKKGKTWACKMCDQKQSLKRFYSVGTAKECRLHVQTLNEIRGEIEDNECTRNSILSDRSNSPNIPEVEIVDYSYASKKSKWEDFLGENNEENQQTPDENTSLNPDVVLGQAKKRFKKASKNKCSTKIPNKNNRLSPSKSENNLVTGNPIECSDPVTVIYKAKPKLFPLEDVSGSKQCKSFKRGFPAADANLSWNKFLEEYDLNDTFVKNDHHSRNEPNEWFSTVDDKDLDTILDF